MASVWLFVLGWSMLFAAAAGNVHAANDAHTHSVAASSSIATFLPRSRGDGDDSSTLERLAASDFLVLSDSDASARAPLSPLAGVSPVLANEEGGSSAGPSPGADAGADAGATADKDKTEGEKEPRTEERGTDGKNEAHVQTRIPAVAWIVVLAGGIIVGLLLYLPWYLKKGHAAAAQNTVEHDISALGSTVPAQTTSVELAEILVQPSMAPAAAAGGGGGGGGGLGVGVGVGEGVEAAAGTPGPVAVPVPAAGRAVGGGEPEPAPEPGLSTFGTEAGSQPPTTETKAAEAETETDQSSSPIAVADPKSAEPPQAAETAHEEEKNEEKKEEVEVDVAAA